MVTRLVLAVANRRSLVRYKNALALLGVLLLLPLSLYLLKPAAVPDLAHGNVAAIWCW
ncbi:hypothetical protein [Pseudomonas sp. BLCC-B112]|uniref:hypothetical protein n=1 Tax=Pseudomonas sp. BLCC-B112 TaxID=3025319 RepID=UPI00234DB148|nr:hypothetical protein [Pseudomonas sp. BLCC-B112]MDC7813056.1 hypothetical protein [Pseudomonas sp. BLCC-B112]